jgi:hypothetical protein
MEAIILSETAEVANSTMKLSTSSALRKRLFPLERLHIAFVQRWRSMNVCGVCVAYARRLRRVLMRSSKDAATTRRTRRVVAASALRVLHTSVCPA